MYRDDGMRGCNSSRNFSPKDFQGEASSKLYLSSALTATETLLAGVKPGARRSTRASSLPFRSAAPLPLDFPPPPWPWRAAQRVPRGCIRIVELEGTKHRGRLANLILCVKIHYE